ncbi:hypothetical protein [Microbacterium sp. USTB-Y]|uniref:DUF7169 domain-containing protein n=1 Tax=Microbacterium sp. USTB-Y TaxID=2823692 RepID=UPI002041E129|nr:hypothetical protein [Microbacterium sp. USTB-Y]
MIAADHALRVAATEHAAAVLRIVDALKVGRAYQWELLPGARLVTPQATTDPTGETATSGTRLALRAATEDALVRLELATAELRTAASALEAALECHLVPAPYRQESLE